jgi:hypothetical protein
MARTANFTLVMAGLVPAIHVLLCGPKGVDAGTADKFTQSATAMPGHDGSNHCACG